jgi:Protein of unknown function (DUF3102)
MGDLAIIPPSRQLSVDDLAAEVRAARDLAFKAASNVVQHSIECGEALILAKAKVRHGEWSRFLKQCEIGERQAQRYIQLAELAKSNPSLRTVLAGLSIQAAIQLLKKTAMASGLVRVSQTSTPPSQDAGGKLNTLAWSNATLTERRRFLDGINLRDLFQALADHSREFLRELLDEPKQSINGHASMSPSIPLATPPARPPP